MAKGLFRVIKTIFGPKEKAQVNNPKKDQNSRPGIDTQRNDKGVPINPVTPRPNQIPYPKTVTAHDEKTGEVIRAQVIDVDTEKRIERPEKPQNPLSGQVDQTKLRARNLAYLNGVRGLRAMNLDADILTDAMEDLRRRYFGNSKPPDEIVIEAKNIIEGKFKQ